MNTPYMYLFVREDLSHPQQIVQASHSAYEMGKLAAADMCPSVVLIGVPNIDGLLQVEELLIRHDVSYHQFYEPDIAEFTAISTAPITGTHRSVFKKFSTMRSAHLSK